MIGGSSLAFVSSALFLGSSSPPGDRKSATTTSSPTQLLSTASSSTTTDTEHAAPAGLLKRREFAFVPYGSSFPPTTDENNNVKNNMKDRPTITCDGRIRRTDGGPHLELTHWANHQTPRELYADTSTEIALNLAKLRQRELLLLQQQSRASSSSDNESSPFQDFDEALVINNHFDADGVLSVFAGVDPETALLYTNLMVQAAEAGDFGEWSSDDGVKLDCTLLAMADECGDDDDAEAYRSILPQVPEILQDFAATGGASYERYWKKGGWDQAVSDWQKVQDGLVKLERYNDSGVVLVYERGAGAGAKESLLSPYALDRALRDAGLWSGTTRILRVTSHHHHHQADEKSADTDVATPSSSFSYEYEKIGHGWIQQVVQRHNVPDVADKDELVKKLNSRFGNNMWTTGGSNGLVSLCQTTKACAAAALPTDVAAALVELDVGAS